MVHNVVINVEPTWVWASNNEQAVSILQENQESKDSQPMKMQHVLVMVPVDQANESSPSVLKVIQETTEEEQQEGEQHWIIPGNGQWQLQEAPEGQKDETQWQLHIEQGAQWEEGAQQWVQQQEQNSSGTWFLEQQDLDKANKLQDTNSELLIVTGQSETPGDEMLLTTRELPKEVVFTVQNLEESQASIEQPSCSSEVIASSDHSNKSCECNKCRKPPGPFYQHMFNCDICGRPFSQKKWLTLHRKTHKKKVYRCTICSKRFSCRSECNVHVRLHRGKKPHECYVCGKWFSFNNQLNEHLKEHAIGKTFQCNVCSNSFSSLNELNDHFKDHTNEAPCKCPKCGKVFDCKKTRALHLITHNKEETSYECVLCGNRFPQASSLAHHLRTHSECYVCGRVFSFSSDLIEHLKEHVDVNISAPLN